MKSKPGLRIMSIDGKPPKRFFLDWEKKIIRQREKEQNSTFSISRADLIRHHKRICRQNLPRNYKCCQLCPFKEMILKVVSTNGRADPKIKIIVH